MDTLLDISESQPSPLVAARKLYDTIKAEFDEADAWQDESGEAIPMILAHAWTEVQAALKIEEARIAKETFAKP